MNCKEHFLSTPYERSIVIWLVTRIVILMLSAVKTRSNGWCFGFGLLLHVSLVGWCSSTCTQPGGNNIRVNWTLSAAESGRLVYMNTRYVTAEGVKYAWCLWLYKRASACKRACVWRVTVCLYSHNDGSVCSNTECIQLVKVFLYPCLHIYQTYFLWCRDGSYTHHTRFFNRICTFPYMTLWFYEIVKF